LRELNAHWPACPSVLLKYTLSARRSSGTYQRPHRSLATSGRPKASATAHTCSASATMERRRFDTVRAERRRAESVWEVLPERRGKTRFSVAMVGCVVMNVQWRFHI